MTVTGQTTQTYAYDNANRLTSITQGTKVTSFAYDTASRVTGMTLANGLNTTYGYDNASQLTAINYLNGATNVGAITYTYDAAGRRISQAGTLHEAFLPTASTTTAVYDANNKLSSWNGISYTYDNNGSLTSDGTKTYLWDARNRLSQIKQGTTVLASFGYDAMNRRIVKTTGAATTKYAYDGMNAVQERSASNVVTANITGGLGTDAWLYRTEGTVSQFFMNDALGSTRALSSDSKAITTRYQYEPFGETTSTGTASANTSQYTGRENDGTGLYYYRARYYSPSLKRFISEDPIGLAGGMNTYAYVGGNPVSFSDPSGLFTIEAQGCLVACSGFSVTVDSTGIQGSVSLGFGYGGGVKMDPNGTLTGQNSTGGTFVNWKAEASVGAQTPIGGVELGLGASHGIDAGQSVSSPLGPKGGFTGPGRLEFN